MAKDRDYKSGQYPAGAGTKQGGQRTAKDDVVVFTLYPVGAEPVDFKKGVKLRM